jgi:hypothetical protein
MAKKTDEQVLADAQARVQARKEHSPRDTLELHLEKLSEHIDRLEANYNPSSRRFTMDGVEYAPDSMVGRVCASAFKGDYTADAIAMRVAMETYTKRKWIEIILDISKDVAPVDVNVGVREIRKFCAFMRDVPDSQARETDIAAMQSHFWQIKRKLGGHYTNEYPLMVIFTGGQEFGKSWSLSKLHSRIGVLKGGGVQLKSFNNEFNQAMFNQFFVIPFEEMNAKVQYDAESLKTLVTEGEYLYREPHAKGYANIKNVATLYGTSNYNVAESIPDSTGARRWWEIRVTDRPFSPSKDTARFSQINFDLMWLAVDGGNPRNPRFELLDEMRIAQKEMKARSPIEEFMDECLVFDTKYTDEVSQIVLFDAYVTWCSKNSEKSKGMKGRLLDAIKKQKGVILANPGENVKYFTGLAIDTY